MESVDFAVCARDSLRIVAAVELDDRSHDAPHRQRRDAFLERAFAVAGVPLARVELRTAQRGADGVQQFYVCTNAPRCRVRYAARDASA